MIKKWLLLAGLFVAVAATAEPNRIAARTGQKFHVWAAGDSHVPKDFLHGRESLAKAIQQSEGFEDNGKNGPPGFPWDIMIDVGDLSASQYPPTEEDGRLLVNQYRALNKHFREDVYNVPGNHDGVYYDQGPGTWFKKWADPLGQHTEFSEVDFRRRRFSVEGTWERYKFQAGNILFLMLADRNSAPALDGEQGIALMAVSAETGKTLSETELPASPVFDGVAAANGKLFISTKDGTVLCLGE